MNFTKVIPNWENAGAEPDVSLQKSGFTAGYRPPAPYFNYLFHGLCEAVAENRSQLSGLDESLVPVSETEIDSIVK